MKASYDGVNQFASIFNSEVIILPTSRKDYLENQRPLTLICVGFLGVRFEVERGGKITPCLKIVRVMLET